MQNSFIRIRMKRISGEQHMSVLIFCIFPASVLHWWTCFCTRKFIKHWEDGLLAQPYPLLETLRRGHMFDLKNWLLTIISHVWKTLRISTPCLQNVITAVLTLKRSSALFILVRFQLTWRPRPAGLACTCYFCFCWITAAPSERYRKNSRPSLADSVLVAH